MAGRSGLQEALSDCYVDVELMQGKNQYRCEACHKLVNAKKVCALNITGIDRSGLETGDGPVALGHQNSCRSTKNSAITNLQRDKNATGPGPPE